MTNHFRGLSVVVPVAPGDDAWRALLPDLRAVLGAQVIFAAARALTPADHDVITAALGSASWRWLETPSGRARQLNSGARAAERDTLWFVHADSRFAPDTLPALHAALRAMPNALLYFELSFLSDGPRAMPLNSLGARFRSRVLGMPFGDQGFVMSRRTFDALGGFDERATYGEDHLFVWRARRAGIALRTTNGSLRTSARRYSEGGWLRTTLRHLWLTTRQAVPEWLALVRQRNVS